MAGPNEVIDLSGDDLICNDLPEYPIDLGVSGAFGGLTGGNYPLICGGYSFNPENQNLTTMVSICYNLQEPSSTLEMTSPRAFSSAAVVNNGNSLWITGGYNYGGITSSTVYVTPQEGKVETGPDLPEGLYGHCVLDLDDKMAMVIGGFTENLFEEPYNSTYFFNKTTNTYIVMTACNI